MVDETAAKCTTNRAETFIDRHRAAGQQSNRLIHEGSPYLLQHAFNPVDWYPWGHDAFQAARAKNRPLFLSIGYSTCHWCHVMERESFEDKKTAEMMNELFINVKIDREERPDIDRIYMKVVQITTGSGGWPMSVFLTPQLQPFYVGTYFPPKPMFGRPSFQELLLFTAKRWQDHPKEVLASAARITTAVSNANDLIMQPATHTEEKKNDDDLLSFVERDLSSTFDNIHGGFGVAPKFPRPVSFLSLFQHYQRSGSNDSLQMAIASLDRMALGGIHDHLRGGFHRYSVDRHWRVPHFEKMLYDQAQLANVFSIAYQITGDCAHALVAASTLDYIVQDLKAPEGGFFSAEDADSACDYRSPEKTTEGAFYLWTVDEIRVALDGYNAEEIEEFLSSYGVTQSGNTFSDPHGEFKNGNVLYRSDKFKAMPGHWRSALLVIRNQRMRPLLDDKVIAGWNGLAISALSIGGRILHRDDFVSAAMTAASFARTTLTSGRKLFRRYRGGENRHPAGLSDYSFMINGLIEAYQSTGEVWLLELASEYTETIIEQFFDQNGVFYDTPAGQKDLIIRSSDLHDAAEPSGTAAAIIGLLRLGRLLGRSDWVEAAYIAVAAIRSIVASQPSMMPLLAVAADLVAHPPLEVVLIGEWDETLSLRHVLSQYFLPDLGIIHVNNSTSDWWCEHRPTISAMIANGVDTCAYICSNLSCSMPVSTPDRLAGELQIN